jgi:hypothetical protein
VYSDGLSFAGLEAYLRISDANFLKPFTDPTMRHSFAASFRPQKNPSSRQARRVASLVASLGIVNLYPRSFVKPLLGCPQGDGENES